MYNFSIFIDNRFAESMQDKINICNHFLINNMEITDEINGKNISDLTGVEVEEYRKLLITNNKKIVLLNCSTPLSDYENYKKVFRKAYMLGVESIKVEIPLKESEIMIDKNDDAACIIGSITENYRKICRIGKSYGIGVLIENNSNTCLSDNDILTSIFKSVNEKSAGLIFNPLEFAKLKSHPFFHVFYNSKIKTSISFMRVTDGLYADGRPVYPGEGNAEVKELVSALLARGYKGYFSFVPYLDNMDMAKFESVIHKFKNLLMNL